MFACSARGITRAATAIRKAGGVPLLLPPGEPRLDALLEFLDGLILSGGGDIDPLHYGSRGHPEVYMIDAARDGELPDAVKDL